MLLGNLCMTPGHYFLAYFRSFQTIYRMKTADLGGIRTRIVGVGGLQCDQIPRLFH